MEDIVHPLYESKCMNVLSKLQKKVIKTKKKGKFSNHCYLILPKIPIFINTPTLRYNKN